MNDLDPTPSEVMRSPRRRQNRENAAADRLPPHSPEAERGILGCLIGEPSLIDVARAKLARGPEDFYDLRHRRIYEVLITLEDERKPVDLITVVQTLREAGHLEAVGGVTYLNEILDSVPSAQNLDTYLTDVRDKASLRCVLQSCVAMVHRIYENSGENVTDLVAGFQSEVGDLTQSHVQANYRPIAQPMVDMITLLAERRRGQNAITGIPTPFWYLNNMTAGLQRGEYSMIAARPSTGKTAMGVDLALHASTLGIPVLFFSIEMSARDICMRLIANKAKVNGLKLRNGFWRTEKEPALDQAYSDISALPLYLDDRKVVSGLDIMLATRRAVREHKVQLVVVDYAQKIAGHRQRSSRQEELCDASAMLARVAKELDVHVCVAAQLGRDAEKGRGGGRPYLSDIKDCGAFEQDADLVGLLWEPKIEDDSPEDMAWLKFHNPDDPKDDGKWISQGPEGGWREEFRRIEFTIGKNRNGPTGDCALVMQRASARFVDAYSPERTKAVVGRLI